LERCNCGQPSFEWRRGERKKLATFVRIVEQRELIKSNPQLSVLIPSVEYRKMLKNRQGAQKILHSFSKIVQKYRSEHFRTRLVEVTTPGSLKFIASLVNIGWGRADD
jgi:hypothetical protein